MSTTTISALPDVPLQNIFKRIPLKDQIHGVRLVCVGWRALLQTELDRRRTLVLTQDGDHLVYSLRQDELHFHDMLQHVRQDDGSPMVRLPTLEQVKYDLFPLRIAVPEPALMSALPGIAHLTVSYWKISPWFLRKIIRMLYHWSETLVSLTLNLKEIIFFNQTNDETLLSMFEAIDQLQSLRHLKFNLTRESLDHKCYMSYPKLEIVSRLSTLCVQNGIHPEGLFDALAQYGSTNVNLRQVCYHGDLLDFDILKFGLKYPRLANCFTDLFIWEWKWPIWNEQSSERMQRFCTYYSYLTTLELDIEPSALFGMAQHLARLRHLTTLKLNIYECENEDEENNRPGFVDGWPILNEIQPPRSQVASVRLLCLSLDTVSHENIAALQFPVIFPNIQVIRLLHYSSTCSTCRYSCWPLDYTSDNEMKNKITECMRLARESFRRCVHLHTIEYNQDPYCDPDPLMRLVSPPEW